MVPYKRAHELATAMSDQSKMRSLLPKEKWAYVLKEGKHDGVYTRRERSQPLRREQGSMRSGIHEAGIVYITTRGAACNFTQILNKKLKTRNS